MGSGRVRPIVSLSFLTAVALVFLTADMALAQQDRRIIRKKAGTPHDTHSERRIALVIGNGGYRAAPLRNPVNDARAMARVLSEVGFSVTKKENLGQKDMKKAIIAFGRELREGGVGLFYYAGHGMQVAGRNFLIPIGAQIQADEEVEVEAVDLNYLLVRMASAKNRLNIVILDACRDNPLARSFRSSGSGLASIKAPRGTIIAYATAPGSVAADGAGAHGLYTQELVRNLRVPGLRIEDVFKRVRAMVDVKSNGRQVPWESSSLMGDFYFVTGKIAASKPEDSLSLERARLEAERKRIAEERRRLEEAKKQQVASLPPKPSVSKPKVIARDGHFEKYANGVVKDTRTGLEWIAGPDRDTSWNKARAWVQNLEVDGGGWRIPTEMELRTLYDKSKGKQNHNRTPLLKTAFFWVWSKGLTNSSSRQAFTFYYGHTSLRGRLLWFRFSVLAVRSRR